MTIADALALIMTVLGVGISLWIAPGEAFGWLKKILILTLALQIFGLFVPSLEGFQVFMIYIMNLASYQMFPETFWVFLQQMFVLFVTWQILLWVVGRHHTNSDSGSGGHSLPRAEGFTTRRI